MPMHEVTPKVVAIAVRMVMTTCNTLLQISFFFLSFRTERSAVKNLNASTNSPLERGRGVLECIHVYASEILRYTPFRSG